LTVKDKLGVERETRKLIVRGRKLRVKNTGKLGIKTGTLVAKEESWE
jgi:hypothetical protein